MLTMIAAALAAAQPAAAPAPAANPHAQHQQAASEARAAKHGAAGEMKDCCCKDHMAKMHGKPADHQGQSGEHQNHKQ